MNTDKNKTRLIEQVLTPYEIGEIKAVMDAINDLDVIKGLLKPFEPLQDLNKAIENINEIIIVKEIIKSIQLMGGNKISFVVPKDK